MKTRNIASSAIFAIGATFFSSFAFACDRSSETRNAFSKSSLAGWYLEKSVFVTYFNSTSGSFDNYFFIQAWDKSGKEYSAKMQFGPISNDGLAATRFDGCIYSFEYDATWTTGYLTVSRSPVSQ